jgi:hypothetical protein
MSERASVRHGTAGLTTATGGPGSPSTHPFQVRGQKTEIREQTDRGSSAHAAASGLSSVVCSLISDLGPVAQLVRAHA